MPTQENLPLSFMKTCVCVCMHVHKQAYTHVPVGVGVCARTCVLLGIKPRALSLLGEPPAHFAIFLHIVCPSWCLIAADYFSASETFVGSMLFLSCSWLFLSAITVSFDERQVQVLL